MKKSASLPLLDQFKGPTYRRLYLGFRQAILDRLLPPGSNLPSSRQLAAHYGIGRNTVTQAYEQLTEEGYIEGRRGSGTFVSAVIPEDLFRTKPLKRSKIHSPNQNRKTEFGITGSSEYPKPLPFLSGIPDLDSFPRETWIKLHNRYLRKSPYSLVNYGHANGYLPLRNAIASHLNTHRGMQCSSEQVIILSGSQQGIDLVCQSLVSPKDTLWIEDPCYGGIRSAIRHQNLNAAKVPLDENGLNVQQGLRLAPKSKLAIVTPSHQFPIGYTMSISRRLELLDWAWRSRSWILEDDYDSEFRYKGKPTPSLQSMDDQGHVIYLGTFSKSLFPDVRIGYLVAPHQLLDSLQSARDASTGNPPISIQATLASFIQEGHYTRHINRQRGIYRKRRDCLIESIHESLSEWLEPGPSDGGLHLATFLKGDFQNAQKLGEAAARQNIALTPFSIPISKLGPHRSGFTLGFSNYTETQIRNAVAACKSTFDE